MTVAECIKDWLNGFTELDISETSTDFLEANIDSFEIFKSPNKDIIDFTDGSSLVTEYYQFFARKSTSLETERISNQQALADLENWIEKKNFDEEYPDLTQAGLMVCEEIGIENSSTIIDYGDASSVYQISIKITYKKEINHG